MYAIADSGGEYMVRYTKQSNIEMTCNYSKAQKWRDGTKANNYLNQFKHKVKNLTLRVIHMGAGGVVSEFDNTAIPYYDKGSYNLPDEFVSAIKLQTGIILACVSEVAAMRESLSDQQVTLEKELFDLIHFVENNVLSASNGYKVYKLMHDKRIQRRKIKNQIAVLKQIENAIATDNLDQIMDNIKQEKEWRYAAKSKLIILH